MATAAIEEKQIATSNRIAEARRTALSYSAEQPVARDLWILLVLEERVELSYPVKDAGF
jgi:hypothetical protein